MVVDQNAHSTTKELNHDPVYETEPTITNKKDERDVSAAFRAAVQQPAAARVVRAAGGASRQLSHDGIYADRDVTGVYRAIIERRWFVQRSRVKDLGVAGGGAATGTVGEYGAVL